jgi:hypothetical protein
MFSKKNIGQSNENIMEENANDILVNDRINNLIHDTFAHVDEDAPVDLMILEFMITL